jgi:hypothetical protein
MANMHLITLQVYTHSSVGIYSTKMFFFVKSPFDQAVRDAEIEDEAGQVKILDAIRVDEIYQSFLDWRFL